MTKTLLALLICCVVGCANIGQWKPHDQALWYSNVAFNVIDILQTREILRDDDYEERNPLIKNDGSLVLVKGLELGIIYLLADKNEKARTPILIIGNLIVLRTVLRNHQIGVKIGF